jgi:hypothetical protein
MLMAQDHRPPSQNIVDIPVTIDIRKLCPAPILEKKSGGKTSPERTAYAPCKRFLSAFKVFFRAFPSAIH